MENTALHTVDLMVKELSELGGDAMKPFLGELEKRKRSRARTKMEQVFSFAEDHGLSLDSVEELALRYAAKLVDEPLVRFLVAAGYADLQGNIYAMGDEDTPPTATDVFNEYKDYCSSHGTPHESRKWFLSTLQRLGVRAWKRSVTCLALSKKAHDQ